jgi:hypothetical protein
MVHVASIDQFLVIVRDVLSLIVSARFQLSSGDFVIANIELQQCLHRIYFQQTQPFKFILDHVQ